MTAEPKPTITYSIVSDLDSKPLRPIIAPLMKAFNRESGHDVYFVKDRHDENIHWYLAKDNEQIVGVMNFNLNVDKSNALVHCQRMEPLKVPFTFHCIGWAYVKPEYRRMGIFRNFVEMTLTHDIPVTVQAPLTSHVIDFLSQYAVKGQIYIFTDEKIQALAFLISKNLKSERKLYTHA